MLTITHNHRTCPDQSSGPKLKCLRTAQASSLSHQITDSSVHSFYAARSSRQIQLRMFSIGSEMLDPPEKLSNDHAHDTQSCCFANKMPQFFEHGLQPRAIGQLQSLPDMLVKRFAQGSALQSAIASASAVLQSTDEMKMAELHDPALARTELDNSGNLVGDRGPDASVYAGGDRCECLRPAPQVLPAWLENRIQEEGSIVMARLDRHHIQNPIFSSKPEIKSVQDQNQGPSGQAQSPRLRYELAQGATKTPTQALMGKAVAWCDSFQCAAVQQYCPQSSRTRAPRLAAWSFLADSPRTLALTALTTSRTKVIDFGFATGRFRVPRMHARELDTDYGSKYLKAQLNSV
jgi:hypothetical protein